MSTVLMVARITASTEPWFHLPPPEPSGPAGLWSSTLLVLLVSGGFVSGLIAWYLTIVRPRDRARGGPVVRALARSVGLDAAERRFLDRVARSAGLPNGGCMLISRGCFDHAARRCMAGDDAARRLNRIRRVAFDDAGGKA